VSPARTEKPGESHEDSPGFTPETLEGLAPARAWGFESPPPHQLHINTNQSFTATRSSGSSYALKSLSKGLCKGSLAGLGAFPSVSSRRHTSSSGSVVPLAFGGTQMPRILLVAAVAVVGLWQRGSPVVFAICPSPDRRRCGRPLVQGRSDRRSGPDGREPPCATGSRPAPRCQPRLRGRRRAVRPIRPPLHLGRGDERVGDPRCPGNLP
jgi:hypothetical protein